MNALLNSTRKRVGDFVFSHLLYPPDSVGKNLIPHGTDYGHGFRYEDFFCRDSTDLSTCAEVCRNSPGHALDLAGGGGRLAACLSRNGTPATLVDNSSSMLKIARGKKEKFRIVNQDISKLDLGHTFKHIFSLKNGLEHLLNDILLEQALARIRRHLTPDGSFYAEVNSLSFCECLSYWKQGKWYYSADIKTNPRKARMWSRSRRGTSIDSVFLEHAITFDLRKYTFLSTEVRILSLTKWVTLFTEGGWKIDAIWGDWLRNPINSNSYQIIFKLNL